MKHQKTVHRLYIFYRDMHNFTQWCHMTSFTFREFCSPQTYCSNKYLVSRHNTLTSFQAAWLKTLLKTFKSLITPFSKVMKHQKTVHRLQIFYKNMHNFTQWCHMATLIFREFCCSSITSNALTSFCILIDINLPNIST